MKAVRTGAPARLGRRSADQDDFRALGAFSADAFAEDLAADLAAALGLAGLRSAAALLLALLAARAGAPPLPAFSESSATACSTVTACGSVPFGSVALILPQAT